ncbi:hypothetical protein Trydic_g21812 [Trypoxylus dichotomus]
MFSNCKNTRRLLRLLQPNRNQPRKYSTTDHGIEKTVIVSESNDIYTNLALEDWHYRNCKFDNRHLLILWSNDPCVVIGKFQNPWLEANVRELGYLTRDGVKLARRNSGGGTVYHDRGNLNITFFTPRQHYNRRHNLEVITQAIRNEYGLEIEITKRDDLVIGDHKVSGTAAKLARTVAYHHCTLLVNSDKRILRDSLRKPQYKIETNATRSTTSNVLNLADVNANITIERLMVCIGLEYFATPIPECAKQHTIGDFNKLRPTEETFPGLIEIRDSLISWEWIYGKCPKFTASKLIPGEMPASVSFVIENGRVSLAQICFLDENGQETSSSELEHFKDRKFCEELFDQVHYCICQKLYHIKN